MTKNRNKTKGILVPLLAGILMLIMCSGVFAQLSDYPFAYVVLTKTDPNPAEPGDYAELWIKIINYANRDMDDFEFKLNPKFPFYLDASETAERKLGKLIAGEQATVHYKVRIDENAVEGTNLLEYAYSFGGRDYDGDLNILVQTLDANLAVTETIVEPEMIAPNKESKVIFRVKNLADSLLRDVTFKLDLESDDIPLVPVGSTNEKKIYSIKDNGETEIEFRITALSDATAQIYKVPLEITYYDETGEEYSKDVMIGLMVGDKPDITGIIEASDIIKKGQVGNVDIKIVNKGSTDIKFLNVYLKETEDFQIVSVDEVYVGEVDSDDYENTEFKIMVEKTKDDKVNLPVLMKYKDANNNEYEEKLNLVLDLNANKLANPQEGGGFGMLILAVVIIVGGWIVYKKWIKKRSKKKKQ